MGKYVVRQIPRPMPDGNDLAAANAGLAKPFQLAGTRGTSRAANKHPDPAIHGHYTLLGTGAETFAGKHLVVFTHGYNVSPSDALESAHEFFLRLATSVAKTAIPLDDCVFLLFTWPGDTGPVYFNDAQQYAQLSGVGLYGLLTDAAAAGRPKSVSLVSHSLGAHVVLRSLAILGERNFRGKLAFRIDRALLLAAAVEDDVFRRPERNEEYHFPEAAFGVRSLHIGISRADEVLAGAFRVNEADLALGYRGPESMEPLTSLSHRVPATLGPAEHFAFEQHDFSPSSATIMNPALQVRAHGDYWKHQEQTDYYATLLQL